MNRIICSSTGDLMSLILTIPLASIIPCSNIARKTGERQAKIPLCALLKKVDLIFYIILLHIEFCSICSSYDGAISE